MVPIDGGSFIPALIGEGVTDYNLSTFYIDKYEVTNKAFKEFVDAKGYELFQYWTDMEFILDGESLSWEEARELMIDSTGKYGPSNWELGSYKDGEENLPVTGIAGMKLRPMQDLREIFFLQCIIGRKLHFLQQR